MRAMIDGRLFMEKGDGRDGGLGGCVEKEAESWRCVWVVGWIG